MTKQRNLIFGLLATLAACAQPDFVPDNLAAPPFPVEVYQRAAAEGAAVYRIDPLQSLVIVHVGRAGAMKNAGHDHVIASEDIEGMVLLGDDPSVSQTDLRIPLQRLIVDKTEYLTRFGLKADVPESAINGTTHNMQNKVLESSTYPWVEIHALIASVHDESPNLSVAMTLHGVTFDYIVPVELLIDPDKLSVTGRMSIQHSDFDLTPFSAVGGLLRVAGQIDIEFEIVALACPAPALRLPSQPGSQRHLLTCDT